jgi:hypothetical protein
MEGRPGAGSHGLDVRFPRQFRVEEHSEIADVLRDLDFHFPRKGVVIHDVSGGVPQEGKVGAGGEEDHGFSLVGVSVEAVTTKPYRNLFEACMVALRAALVVMPDRAQGPTRNTLS